MHIPGPLLLLEEIMQMQKIIPHADLAFVPQGNKLGISAKITSEKQTNTETPQKPWPIPQSFLVNTFTQFSW